MRNTGNVVGLLEMVRRGLVGEDGVDCVTVLDEAIGTLSAAPRFNVDPNVLNRVLAEIADEYLRAKLKFPAQLNGAHEGYAVLLEEVDELWDDIKANRHGPARKEAVQVAAMAVRFLMEVPSETGRSTTSSRWGLVVATTPKT